METRLCPRTHCKVDPKSCGKNCVCPPHTCDGCKKRTQRARAPQGVFYKPQDHASTPERKERVERIVAGTPVTDLEPQGSLF